MREYVYEVEEAADGTPALVRWQITKHSHHTVTLLRVSEQFEWHRRRPLQECHFSAWEAWYDYLTGLEGRITYHRGMLAALVLKREQARKASKEGSDAY